MSIRELNAKSKRNYQMIYVLLRHFKRRCNWFVPLLNHMPGTVIGLVLVNKWPQKWLSSLYIFNPDWVALSIRVTLMIAQLHNNSSCAAGAEPCTSTRCNNVFVLDFHPLLQLIGFYSVVLQLFSHCYIIVAMNIAQCNMGCLRRKVYPWDELGSLSKQDSVVLLRRFLAVQRNIFQAGSQTTLKVGKVQH